MECADGLVLKQHVQHLKRTLESLDSEHSIAAFAQHEVCIYMYVYRAAIWNVLMVWC